MMLRNTFIASALMALTACSEPGVVPYQAPATDARVLRDIRIVDTIIDISAMDTVTAGRAVAVVEVFQALEDAAAVSMRYNVGDRPVSVQLVVDEVTLREEGRIFGGGANVMTGSATLVDRNNGTVLSGPVPVTALFNPGVNTRQGVIDSTDFRGDDAVVLDLASQFIERARQALVGG